MAADSIHFDDALLFVGTGRFQVVIIFVNVLFQLLAPFCTQVILFLGATPEHVCTPLSNATTSLPLESLVDINKNLEFRRCWQFEESFQSNRTVLCQEEWTYDEEFYGETIVSEWNLVCSKQNVVGLTQSLMMLAGSFGSVFLGRLADRYGRRPLIRSTLLIFVLAGVAIVFSPNIFVFSFLFIVIGFTQPGYWITLQVLLLEYLPPHQRSAVSAWPSFFQSIGSVLLGLTAMFIRDWRYLQLALMVLPILTLPVVWFIPESARWYLSMNKFREAENILQRIAKFNNKESIGPLLLHIPSSTAKRQSEEVISNYPEILVPLEATGKFERIGSEKKPSKNKYEETLPKFSVSDILKAPVLSITVIVCVFSVIYSLVYFGFVLNTGNLAGNPYVNFILGGLVEIPARLIPALVIKRLGGRIIACLLFTLSGMTLTISIILPSETSNETHFFGTSTIVSLIGRFFITAVNTSVLILPMELFPTPVRALGNGLANFFGRLGGVLAPLLLLLDNVLPGLATIVMALSSLLAGFLIYLLPETLNEPQPETINDLELLMQKQRRLCPIATSECDNYFR